MTATLDSILKVLPNLNDFMILWQLLQVFAPILSPHSPHHTFTFFAYIHRHFYPPCYQFLLPTFSLKKKEGSPICWCLLAEIFAWNQSNPNLFQLRIWPQDFQCLSCNRSRIRPGHYMFGRSPRHFQVLQKTVPAILQFVRIFFPLSESNRDDQCNG